MMSLLKQLFSIHALKGHAGRLTDGSRAYLPELTGLRAVAIIVIVCGHLFQRIERSLQSDTPMAPWQTVFFKILATPFTGCCIFFVVSGYVLFISRPMQALALRNIHKYCVQRILYVVPPYYVILFASFLAIAFLGYEPRDANSFFAAPESLTQSLLASLTFSHMLLYGTFPRLFPPGWFIETQVQFYIVGPYVWHLYSSMRPGLLRLSIGTLILVAAVATSILVSAEGSRNLRYSILVFMPYFWAGALIADWQQTGLPGWLRRHLAKHPGLGWLALALLILLGAPLVDSSAFYLIARLLVLGLLVLASFPRSSFRRVLTARGMIRIGVATLSIFLVHLQVLYVVVPEIARTVPTHDAILHLILCSLVGISVVALVALAFYWLVERPLLVIWQRSRYA